MMLELVAAVVWWPMLIAGAVVFALIAHVLIETLMDWVWGKQPRGSKWSRK